LVCNFCKSIEPKLDRKDKSSNGFQHYWQDLQVTDEGDGSDEVEPYNEEFVNVLYMRLKKSIIDGIVNT
jgi:hypothetical protein